MLDPAQYDDVLVLVMHPWGDFHVPLPTWIERGPGARPLVKICSAERISTGEPVAMSEIPLQYHNCRRGRALQRRGLLPMPWGPPTPLDPVLPDPAGLPPHLRHLARDCDHD